MRVGWVMLLAASLLSFAAPAGAAEEGKAAGGKGKYLVTATHTPEECLATMDEVAKDKKLLEKAEWGCLSGDHTVYLTTQADSPEAAIKMLPEHDRANAKAVKLTKLTPAQLKKFHEEAKGAAK
jgi:hypothetical protein